MASLGFELLVKLLWGWFFVLIWVRRTESSEKFLKISFRIVLGTALVAFFLPYSDIGLGPKIVVPTSTLVAMVLGHYFYSFHFHRTPRILGFLLYFFSPLGFWVSSPDPTVKTFFGVLEFFAGACLLGGVFMSQFLGHWFLNVPGMEIGELKRTVKFFFFGLTLKTLLVAGLWVNLFLNPPAWNSQAPGPFSGAGLAGEFYFGLSTYGVIILTSRILWGILAPWLLGVLVHKTVAMRSTQSATGILYALSVMILLGEGTAIFIRQALGWIQ